MSPLTTPARGLLERAPPRMLPQSTAVSCGGVAVACPGCQSPNVERLSHYWEALPAESPQRARYAPPAVSQAPALLVLGALLGGVWIAWTGPVLWGVGIVVAALVWGVVAVGSSIASQARRDEWASTQLCLTCTRRWT